MKIETLKIVKGLDLGEYAEEIKGTVVRVWVNPPMRWLNEHDGLIDDVKRIVEAGIRSNPEERPGLERELEAAAGGLRGKFIELWSQGPEGSGWTAEEIGDLVETDPQLWIWLRKRSIEMIREHRAGVKKN